MNNISTINNQRHWILLVAAVLLITATMLVVPVPQDPAYHGFADGRGWLSIANFGDVASNLPFALVGILGLIALLRNNLIIDPAERTAYLVLFGGVLLVCFGSSYYHLAPDNQRLVWDRLPMTLAFMGLFSAIIGERISSKAGRVLLWPLVLVGLLSVLYWHFTEQQGQGDLRPYALVQFLPMLLIPLILWLYPSGYRDLRYFIGLLGFYALSKITEHWDEAIFEQLGFISGHSIKHILAAAGVYCFYLGLKQRALKAEGD